MPVRITTWNVNGIRNPFGYQPWRDKRTFDGMFDLLEADIVVMQELKIQRKDLRDDMVLVPGWDCYFSLPKHKKGYSGIGIYTRTAQCAPIRAEEGVLGVLSPPGSTTAYRDLPDNESIGGYHTASQLAELAEIGVDAVGLDAEGRCVVLEFPAFVLFGIYSPANSSGTRDDYRLGFLTALDARVRNLIKAGKQVVVCGDLNVSRGEIDMAGAEDEMRKQGITHEEYISTPNRRIFNQLLKDAEVIGPRDEGREQPVMWDVCRGFHPTRKGMYTHWEQKVNARPGNFGSRIDFVLCSLAMESWFESSDIQEGLMGSDHCPVFAVMRDHVVLPGDDQSLVALRDVMFPKGYYKDGAPQKEYAVKDAPVFSARQMPEFDKRRSIRDMFSKPPLKPPASSARPDMASSPNKAKECPGTTILCSNADGSRGGMSPTKSNTPTPMHSPGGNSTTSSRPSATRSLKRSRSGAGESLNNGHSQPASKGQQTLKGFFLKPSLASGDSNPATSHLQGDVTQDTKDAKDATRAISPAKSPAVSFTSTAEDEGEYVHDPIVAKESWSKVFSKPIAPLCEHEEPCQMMKSKKKGFNNGREFWMCARPLGPSGAKEKNTQWRCPTFIWSSDWVPKLPKN